MFFLVQLRNQGLKLLVPSKWIKNLKIKELLNYGVIYQRKIEYVVFYSPIITDEPDFTLNIQQVFNGNRNGCYRATILKPFESLSEGMAHINHPNNAGILVLDDSDVEYIQNILDESSSEDENNVEVPRPMNPTN